jgi:nicotinamide-nucleotide amidase
MKSCIIAVGSELLTPFRTDTNSLTVTGQLNAAGFEVRAKEIVGDQVDEVVRAIERALGWADLIVMTGGLGPTADDVTREALAQVVQQPLELHPEVVGAIAERFARRGLSMPEINRRQAMAPRGAALIENRHGTAPGLWIERGSSVIIALPGPPREMAPMLDAVVRDRLTSRGGGARVFRRTLKITGRTESDVDAIAEPVYGRWTGGPVPITTTILAVFGQIELHLTAISSRSGEAEASLDAAVRELETLLGPAVYSVDGRSLEAVLGELLRRRGLRVAVAESCTGGLLTSRLTDVPGSSDYVERGLVCYSDRAKIELLGIPETLIAAHGAVSEPVAEAMASAVRTRPGASVGLGVTGIAGPGGGSAAKPVGTVAIAVDMDRARQVRTFHFAGDRGAIKFQAAQAAMNMLRLLLRESGG